MRPTGIVVTDQNTVRSDTSQSETPEITVTPEITGITVTPVTRATVTERSVGRGVQPVRTDMRVRTRTDDDVKNG